MRNRNGGGWSLQSTKTPGSRRCIPFPSYLVRKLEAHKRAQNEARLKLGAAWENNDLVFASNVGTPLSIRNLQRRHFKPLLDKAKLEDIRTYDLRHSCATLLLAAGENPKVVSERLGHAFSRFLVESGLTGQAPTNEDRIQRERAILQLARVGNNLNQIARQLNAQRGALNSRDIAESLEEVQTALERIEVLWQGVGGEQRQSPL